MQELKNSDRRVYDYKKYKIRQNKKEVVMKQLINKGFKLTKQRLILLDIILNERCSSCKEIHYKASKLNKNIGIATVYRMINLLESVGVVNKENMYKFSCEAENDMDCVYEIRYDDTIFKLSSKEWNNVVRAGLNSCGYVKDSDSVLMNIKNQNAENIEILCSNKNNNDIGGK